MKTDKTKLMKDIEAMKKKLASMEEELNKPEEFKHLPSKSDEYYYYTSIGLLYRIDATEAELRINTYKTREEAVKAYNKEVALEKVKRRIIELQGDWKPDWKFCNNKYTIIYSYYYNRFDADDWTRSKFPILIPYMKTREIANAIINEMEDELKLIFDMA